MTQPILHDAYHISQRIPASRAQVFAAFADLSMRRRWYRIPGEPGTDSHELDLRVGGTETMRGRFAAPDGMQHITYQAHFLDVVENERMVYSAEAVIDGVRISASLITIELADEDGATRLSLTEQFAFLHYTGDGHDDIAERKGSAPFVLNSLIAALRTPEAP
jgi:uncharacterized protein YndB with AHSA1/START domain